MQRLQKTAADIPEDPKGVACKVAIAKRLGKENTANNLWIAQRLKMGHPNYVSTSAEVFFDLELGKFFGL